MLERYRTLLEQLDLGEGVPFSPNWSADVDFLQLLADYCRQARPSLIVECSSGLSTLVLARSCQINGHGRVISLEDGIEFVTRTRAYLDLYALAPFAEVIHAPLHDLELNGTRYAWYTLPRLPDEAWRIVSRRVVGTSAGAAGCASTAVNALRGRQQAAARAPLAAKKERRLIAGIAGAFRGMP